MIRASVFNDINGGVICAAIAVCICEHVARRCEKYDADLHKDAGYGICDHPNVTANARDFKSEATGCFFCNLLKSQLGKPISSTT